jgi:hypothetical protein
MRWPAKEMPIYRNGDVRTRNRFLLFPKRVNGERRWLEKAYWTEVMDCNYGNFDDWEFRHWCPLKWISA